MNEAKKIPWIQSESMSQPRPFPGVYWLPIKMINDKPVKFSCPNSLTFVLEWFILERFSTPFSHDREVAVTFSWALCRSLKKCSAYPDFADGVSEALVVSGLTERYGIKLSLVEVGHGALPLLLPERFGGFQGVLKRAAANRKQTGVRFTHLDMTDLLINCTSIFFVWTLTNIYSISETKTQHMAEEMRPDQRLWLAQCIRHPQQWSRNQVVQEGTKFTTCLADRARSCQQNLC